MGIISILFSVTGFHRPEAWAKKPIPGSPRRLAVGTEGWKWHGPMGPFPQVWCGKMKSMKFTWALFKIIIRTMSTWSSYWVGRMSCKKNHPGRRSLTNGNSDSSDLAPSNSSFEEETAITKVLRCGGGVKEFVANQMWRIKSGWKTMETLLCRSVDPSFLDDSPGGVNALTRKGTIVTRTKWAVLNPLPFVGVSVGFNMLIGYKYMVIHRFIYWGVCEESLNREFQWKPLGWRFSKRLSSLVYITLYYSMCIYIYII